MITLATTFLSASPQSFMISTTSSSTLVMDGWGCRTGGMGLMFSSGEIIFIYIYKARWFRSIPSHV